MRERERERERWGKLPIPYKEIHVLSRRVLLTLFNYCHWYMCKNMSEAMQTCDFKCLFKISNYLSTVCVNT